jgi:hypothetical protein
VASGFDEKVTAFRGDAASLARYNFARQLAEDFAVRIIHADPGTLWTDLKGRHQRPVRLEMLKLDDSTSR